MSENQLNKYRDQIDQIDRQIIKLLEERFEVVRGVGEYKKAKGFPVLDAAREKQKLEALTKLCEESKRTYMEEILKGIMAQSRRFQEDHEVGQEQAPGEGKVQAPGEGLSQAQVAPACRFGLLGRKLSHSHSPVIHKMLGGYEYGIFEREPEHLEAFFEDDSWEGINVTIPYKREVMKYCDELSETAIACNSVNTIVREHEEHGLIIRGHNTDYDGFRYMVECSGIDPRGKKALVLGSGGVSGTVSQVMKDLGADPVIIISRSGENNYGNLDRHKDAAIIINTTPVGMFPNAGEAALDIGLFPACEAVYDLIYNPLRTKLMLDAQRLGIPAYGGLLMLVAQAAKAGQLFGQTLTKTTEHVYQELRKGLENIVLIGMPGAGKTTTGKILAENTGRRFLDLDHVITQHQGRTPEEIILEDGVDRFREIESQVLETLVRGIQTGGLVLACGGGIVEREHNRELLQENGQVVWLRRELSELPTEGRPVSQAEGLQRILQRREPAYESWSDLAVDAIGVQETAARIEQRLRKE